MRCAALLAASGLQADERRVDGEWVSLRMRRA